MRSQSDEEWKVQIRQQAEANRQMIADEKDLERAKKNMLNQEYLAFEREKQNKQQEKANSRMAEQKQITSLIEMYNDDTKTKASAQRSLQANLSSSYAGVISQNKQYGVDQRQKQVLEERALLERSLQAVEAEKLANHAKRARANEEMSQFFESKKRQELYSSASNSNNSKQAAAAAINSQQQLGSIGSNHHFKKYYQQQENQREVASKNFVSFDGTKDKQIQDHISRGIQEDRERQVLEEEHRKSLQQNRRADLMSGLKHQLASKEQLERDKKVIFQQNQSEIAQRGMEIRDFENAKKQKKFADRLQYKDILDSQMANKDKTMTKSHVDIHYQQQQQQLPSDDKTYSAARNAPYGNASQMIANGSTRNIVPLHNPLTNPIPSNMQNPYLLKQILSSSSQVGSPQFRIASGAGSPTDTRLNYANLATSMLNNNNQRSTEVV